MMLTYNEFKELVKRELEQKLGEEYKVFEERMVKNNDIALDALTALRKDSNMSPVIYPQEWYEKYQEGFCLAEMLEDMVDLLCAHCPIDVSVLEKDFAHLSENITMALVKKEWNKTKLKDLVTRDFLDLAIIFKVELQSETHLRGTCNITKKMLELWGITEETLIQTAWLNLKQERVVLKDVFAVITKDDEEIFELEDDGRLYVLTNENMTYGAVMMLRKDILGTYADTVGRNLYILPSSLHESLLLVDDGTHNAKELQAMVKDINANHVEPKEVLSDSVYYYDREFREVRKV